MTELLFPVYSREISTIRLVEDPCPVKMFLVPIHSYLVHLSVHLCSRPPSPSLPHPQSGDGVRVRFDCSGAACPAESAVSGSAVVVTSPPGPTAAIRFDPPLGRVKADALRRVNLLAATKVGRLELKIDKKAHRECC